VGGDSPRPARRELVGVDRVVPEWDAVRRAEVVLECVHHSVMDVSRSWGFPVERVDAVLEQACAELGLDAATVRAVIVTRW
jgi:hypothetical protein